MGMSGLAAWLLNILLAPLGLILNVLLIGALLLCFAPTRRWGRRLALGGGVLYLLFYLAPVDVWGARLLENRFPRPPLPQSIDGVVVLDGGMQGNIVDARAALAQDPSVTRLVAAARLARLHPGARLVYAAGLGAGKKSQEEIAAILFREIGIGGAQLVIESASRNTWENLVNAKALANPKDGETWMLVTSAVHMPRAVAIARHLKWKMIPWPSEYLTAPDNLWSDWSRDKIGRAHV